MTEETKTGTEEIPVEGKTPSPPNLEVQTKEVERLQGELQKMEHSHKSLQGISRKQAQDLETLRGQYDTAVSSRDTYQALIGLMSQQTGRSEEDIETEVQTKKPDLIKQAQAIVNQQNQQRQYAQFNQRVNAYQKTVDDLGLKPTDKTYKHIRALVRSGDFEAADEEIEAIKTEKVKPTTEPKKGEQKVELTEEEKEKISKEYLEKKGLLKSETGAPSASAPRGFAKIEQAYADGEISTAEYEEAMKQRGKR